MRGMNAHASLVGVQIFTVGKYVWWFLRTTQIDLPQGLATPLLDIYPMYASSYRRDSCSPMFIAALFIIARHWKQPRHPSTDEWFKKMWYIYTTEYHSAVKKMTT